MFCNPTSDLGFMHHPKDFALYVSTFGVQPSYRDISVFMYTLRYGMEW